MRPVSTYKALCRLEYLEIILLLKVKHFVGEKETSPLSFLPGLLLYAHEYSNGLIPHRIFKKQILLPSLNTYHGDTSLCYLDTSLVALFSQVALLSEV